MKKTENIIGFVLLIAVFILGKNFLASDMHLFRLVMGIALGYTLTRAATGFAGSVNRAANTGSTKLMKTLMFMFFITTALSASFMIFQDPSQMDLWVNPINGGLLVGGVLFGFGMAFSSCCASGVLTDLITSLPRALITLVFFSFGVFIGFPLQKQGWVATSWFVSEVGSQTAGGVFLPDLFKWDGLGGYLGALILTALLCGLVVVLANKYEAKRKKEGTYTGHFVEKGQDSMEAFEVEKDYAFPTESTYERLFVKTWTLKQGAVIIAILFTLLMGVTKAGWGASTPYGYWFGKFLTLFGVSAESLGSFAQLDPAVFSKPFLANPVTVQNMGILVGTSVYLLTAGKFKNTFMSELHITVKDGLLYAMGGITMGVGTRLANGCNVGALYTPIANFSLSGWVFLVVMVIGGYVGNKLAKHLQK
ncbi:YeeE/YedE family protein [Erysipelothrix enhydrae]|uniref:YeeE/YedE family protein n=1 Tax=Erysipelothrix enhydrae TaxID=2890314 RepID=UPI002B24A860|nr:YeeE/YedE family protein [Erysipelothrix sp. 4322-04]WRB86310.1 YeeE/YedE family protein [Erysipelothrix sp. 4322-04]